MKNLLLIFILLIPVMSYAQFSYGVKGGLNLNHVRFSNGSDEGTKMDLGYHLGIYGEVPLSKKISFIPELQFSKKGYKYESAHIHLNYLDLPLMFCWRPEKVVGLEFGPGISFKVSAKAKIDGYKTSLGDVYEKNIDAGFNFGVRIFANDRISLLARYYFGLIPIDETYYVGFSGNDSSVREYNRNLQFSVAYSLISNKQ